MKQLSLSEYAENYFDRIGSVGEESALWEAEASDYVFPPRPRVSHKYSYGRALIVAGALGYSGAPALAANACERSGAGLTQLLVPDRIYPIAAARCDGAVVTPLPSDEKGGFGVEALPELLKALKKAKACAVGPGLGGGAGARALVRAILQEAECPLVLDADALTVCGQEPELLARCRAPLILTPHEGEFRRLGGALDKGRLAGARAWVEQAPPLILILKGYGTLICRRGEATVNPTGGPAMAKGGSGDVLCGVLCALLAQGFEPWLAARCAVWLHGAAGDLAAAELGEYALAPSDLIRFLPQAILKQTKQTSSIG